MIIIVILFCCIGAKQYNIYVFALSEILFTYLTLSHKQHGPVYPKDLLLIKSMYLASISWSLLLVVQSLSVMYMYLWVSVQFVTSRVGRQTAKKYGRRLPTQDFVTS